MKIWNITPPPISKCSSDFSHFKIVSPKFRNIASNLSALGSLRAIKMEGWAPPNYTTAGVVFLADFLWIPINIKYLTPQLWNKTKRTWFYFLRDKLKLSVGSQITINSSILFLRKFHHYQDFMQLYNLHSTSYLAKIPMKLHFKAKPSKCNIALHTHYSIYHLVPEVPIHLRNFNYDQTCIQRFISKDHINLFNLHRV